MMRRMWALLLALLRITESEFRFFGLSHMCEPPNM